MRFWITKGSDVPVREQLVRQVLLGILSEDFPAGRKLPSVRALARRHGIHSNTVSAAYHDLLERGWLELRKGSGLYVRPLHAFREGQQGLDRLLTALLQSARGLGHEPEEVLTRLEHLVRPRAYRQILIVEPDPAMREILHTEIAEHVGARVDATESSSGDSTSLVVSLPTRAAAVRRGLAAGTLFVPLRLSSVHAALEGHLKPPKAAVISIASRSAEIRFWARSMLIAFGLDPDSLQEVNASEAGWAERLKLSTFVITDVVTAKGLPAGSPARIFRVIADSSLTEVKEFLGDWDASQK
jgi:DNA-binding transcriptional regulator YhcF (GntR family)